MPALDETYEPRYWRCDECRRVLGVVMRDMNRVRKLWAFRVDRIDTDVPRTSTLDGSIFTVTSRLAFAMFYLSLGWQVAAEQCVHTDPPSALVSAADSTNTAGG